MAAPVPTAALELEAAGYSRSLARLLARSGVDRPEVAGDFLAPSLDQLHPASLLLGLPAAVELLCRACRSGSKVAVVGDYDVDGVTATAILIAVLRSAGATAEPILARRHEEGYGFQTGHARRAAAAGASLVVTVDCGTNSRPAVAEAVRLGMAVVVTDHHLPDGDGLPDAVLINPRQPGCPYPNRELTGAGLAFKLAAATLEALARPVPWDSLLRVACLGTIADVAPLRGENRVLAALGLRALAGTRSPGLRALIENAGLRAPIRSSDVAFRLAPRLNAAGRLDEATPALELLLERDPGRARELAARLEDWNRKRQSIEARILAEARELIARQAESRGLAVAWSPDWNRGVVGIVAGRLARELGRPTVLLAAEGESATGSGRSVRGIHLHDLLRPWADRMEKFGGHAQAIGLTVGLRGLQSLADEWRAAAIGSDVDPTAHEQSYDLELSPAELTESLHAELERMEPFGAGNEEPLARIGPWTPAGPARRFGEGHAALPARGLADPVVRELVGWGWGNRFESTPEQFEVLARIERDRWRGGTRLILVDWRPVSSGSAQ